MGQQNIVLAYISVTVYGENVWYREQRVHTIGCYLQTGMPTYCEQLQTARHCSPINNANKGTTAEAKIKHSDGHNLTVIIVIQLAVRYQFMHIRPGMPTGRSQLIDNASCM